MREPEGGKIGRYEILAKVGEGANGVVYRAQDPTIRRVVALKVIPSESAAPGAGDTAGGRSSASFFEREAQAAGALLHPNIVTLYDAGHDRDWYYLAMEFIQGGTFLGEIRDGVSVERAVEVTATVADALDYAHEHGVVHRDIKPANLMILPDRTVKVADFGIARLTGSTSTMTSDMMVGTPHYMSPEQVQGGKIDGRSDVFSLGVVLYEALTGKKPFEADSLPAILGRIMKGSVTPANEAAPTVPAKLSAIVAKAMAREPEQRYGRARDLAADLRAFLREYRGEGPIAGTPSRSWLPAVAGALVLAVAIGAGAFFLGPGGPPPPPPPPKIGTVFFENPPGMSGVEIYYDGSKIGTTPLVKELPAGKIDVEFRKEGYHPLALTIPVEPDTRNDFEVPELFALEGR